MQLHVERLLTGIFSVSRFPPLFCRIARKRKIAAVQASDLSRRTRNFKHCANFIFAIKESDGSGLQVPVAPTGECG